MGMVLSAQANVRIIDQVCIALILALHPTPIIQIATHQTIITAATKCMALLIAIHPTPIIQMATHQTIIIAATKCMALLIAIHPTPIILMEILQTNISAETNRMIPAHIHIANTITMIAE